MAHDSRPVVTQTTYSRARRRLVAPTGLSGRIVYTPNVSDLSERSVATRVPSLLDEPIKSVGRPDPVSVRPGTSLGACLAAIRQSGMGDSVLVTDPSGRLLGVLTERDIFAQLVVPGADLDRPGEALMNTTPNTLHIDQPVRDAIVLMQTGRFRNVPLVDDEGLLAGVVRPQNILKFLAEAFPEELLNLPPRPHQRIEESEGA